MIRMMWGRFVRQGIRRDLITKMTRICVDIDSTNQMV